MELEARPARTTMMLNRSGKAYRAWLQRAADTEPIVRLVPGHGAVVTDDPVAVLRRIAAGS
jgi:hypothetical protein